MHIHSQIFCNLTIWLFIVLEDDVGGASDTAPPPAGPAPSTTGKYVPPSMRAGASRAGESMRGPGNREDLPTLRVTNISEDTQENDLRELFGVFGRISRVYVGRDRETGAGKGFAFVSFEDRAAAEKAQEKVNGKGYDNLILSVQWSREFLLLPFPSSLLIAARASSGAVELVLSIARCALSCKQLYIMITLRVEVACLCLNNS